MHEANPSFIMIKSIMLFSHFVIFTTSTYRKHGFKENNMLCLRCVIIIPDKDLIESSGILSLKKRPYTELFTSDKRFFAMRKDAYRV